MPLTDSQWKKISKVENLDAAWRSDIDSVIDSFLDFKRGQSAQPRKPREAIKTMQSRARKLQKQIEDFAHEYILLLAIHEEEAKELKVAVATLGTLSDTLERTYQKQITFRREFPLELSIEYLLGELLTIRSNALGKPNPTSTRNSAYSGRFRDFLLACLEVAHPGLPKEKFDERLRAVLVRSSS